MLPMYEPIKLISQTYSETGGKNSTEDIRDEQSFKGQVEICKGENIESCVLRMISKLTIWRIVKIRVTMAIRS